jgi:peptidoglycan/xylan/chitin deacetylase (PgdA/CDA1 family)
MKNSYIKTLKIFIGSLTFLFSIYLFFYLRYKDKIFILVYHRIDNYQGGLKSLYVKPKIFEKQMKYLFSRGYKTTTLSEFKNALQRNDKKFLKKRFCITFDDGYEDLLNAYPILKKYDYKATVYVHTKAIQDGFYTYPHMVSAKMISVEQLKSIMDVFEVGSHTASHPDLSKCSDDEIVKELKESKDFLERNLKIEVKHFCYPFGKVFSNYEEILKKEGFETAVTLNNGLLDLNKNIDFYSLSRVEWKEFSSMSFKDFLKNFEFYLKIFFGI